MTNICDVVRLPVFSVLIYAKLTMVIAVTSEWQSIVLKFIIGNGLKPRMNKGDITDVLGSEQFYKIALHRFVSEFS